MEIERVGALVVMRLSLASRVRTRLKEHVRMYTHAAEARTHLEGGRFLMVSSSTDRPISIVEECVRVCSRLILIGLYVIN